MGRDITGQVFGMLTVLAFDRTTSYGTGYWNCRCVCGRVYSVQTTHLKRGRVAACPCLSEAVEAGTVEKRPIPGFPGYFAGSDGEIYSMRPRGGTSQPPSTARRLRPALGSNGYRTVVCMVDRKDKTMKVATLVCIAFHGERPDGMHVCHGSPDRLNDRPEHLSWGTPKSNNYDDKHRDGTIRRGENSPVHKLTAEQVRAIRCLEDHMMHKDIAKRFGVSEGHVINILRNKTWKWLQ